MKNLRDIEKKLRKELDKWYPKQIKNIFADHYLYYQESKPDFPGKIRIESESWPNKIFKVAWNQPIRKDLTIDQNFTLLHSVIRRLPVLEI